MGWHSAEDDVLAVGYTPKLAPQAAEAAGGPADATAAAITTSAPARSGCVLLWSARTPGVPLLSCALPESLGPGVGVTAVAFAQSTPTVVAAGLSDGTVCVWDTREVRGWMRDGTAEGQRGETRDGKSIIRVRSESTPYHGLAAACGGINGAGKPHMEADQLLHCPFLRVVTHAVHRRSPRPPDPHCRATSPTRCCQAATLRRCGRWCG
jgi:hypothetical protein